MNTIDQLTQSNGVGVIVGGNGDGSKKPAKLSSKELNEYKSIVEKIGEIDRDYARQFMDSNEAEVQAVKDKFADIRKEIEDYNSKKPKILIDITKINTIEQQAIDNTRYKQNTDSLVKSLEEQKPFMMNIIPM